MVINYNHHITPIQNMKRYFSENKYRKFYALIRKSYSLGGDELATKMNNDLYNRYPLQHKFINAAWITFCNLDRTWVNVSIRDIYEIVNNNRVYPVGNIDLWKRDNGEYAIRYACDTRTEYFGTFKKAYETAKDLEFNVYSSDYLDI